MGSLASAVRAGLSLPEALMQLGERGPEPLRAASPWAVLLALSLQPDVIGRYRSTAGVIVLVVGAVACFVAYRLMVRLGRLPDERRVLT